MIKIALHCPNFEDGTSYYRVQRPLSRLRKKMALDIAFFANWNASVMGLVDAVLIQRPYDDSGVNIAKLCKLAGVPLWVDYDDDVFQVGMSHQFFHVYNSPQVRANVQLCLDLADVISVSTEQLKKVMESKTKTKVVVIPNALDMDLPTVKGREELKAAGRNPVVLFRGSNSHEKDLIEVGADLIDVLRAHPEVQFHSMGYLPWMINECIPSAQWAFSPWSDPFIYFQQLCELRPMVVVHPLEDNLFNRGKSNCSWIETTVANAPFITRKLPEFEKPGILTYSTPEEFAVVLEKLLKGDYPLDALVDQSWGHIKENYTLEKANELREELILNLVS